MASFNRELDNKRAHLGSDIESSDDREEKFSLKARPFEATDKETFTLPLDY